MKQMTPQKASRHAPKSRPPARKPNPADKPGKEVIILTGISGAGKASALKAFEDLGYHCVDNLPLELLPQFAAIVGKSTEVERAAIVMDVREGATLDRLPEFLKSIKKLLLVRVVYLDAQDAVLVRRYSETRRPQPLGLSETVSRSIVEERQLLDPMRNVADTLIDTSNFNVHELRADIHARFGHEKQTKRLLISCLSFGFKNGVPLDADMVFDVRFLPNPHFVPEFRKKTGQDRKVAAYITGFPQTREFLTRVTELMLYLLPHYIEEGKSYLTVAFGCTGGQHRSVMMAEEMCKRLKKAGYRVKPLHLDMPRCLRRGACVSIRSLHCSCSRQTVRVIHNAAGPCSRMIIESKSNIRLRMVALARLYDLR